ncbi:MAG TPA: hypothetical protein VJH67_02390 [Candidatus Paceibacterota bacterium]
MRNKYLPAKKDFFFALSLACLSLLGFLATIFLLNSKSASLVEALPGSLDAPLDIETVLAIKKTLAEKKVDIETLNSSFVTSSGEVAFIETVEKIAALSGVDVEIVSVDVGEYGGSKNFESLNLQVRFEGNWSEAEGFLSSVEDAPYAVTLGDIEMTASQNAVWLGEVGLSVLKVKNK